MKPGWDKYQAAKERFRAGFGHTVLFHVPEPESFPEGTALNSAGVPLDPSVDGSGGGWSDASGVFNVVVGPVRPDDGAERSPVGFLPDGEIAVVVPDQMFTDPVNKATEMTHNGSRYRVTSREERRYGPVVDRIVFGARK